MSEEFKISRLIFTWVGEWATTTVYKRDDITQYEGKSYVCIEPHTASANFYDDLNFPVFPRWELMIDGKVWKQEWQPSTFYSIGNIVVYGGVVYICTIPHTSSVSEIDLTKWDTFARFGKWDNVWQTNTVYGVDDIVKYGGIVYRCIEGHTSAATAEEGLEADIGLDSSAEKWEVVNLGIDYKGTFVPSGFRYKRNDVVKDGPGLFICKEGHTTDGTWDINLWDVFIPGLGLATTWGAGILYQQGDTVIYGGYSYTSNIQDNIGNIPSISSSQWTLLNQGYNLENDWSSGTNYLIGDVVRRGGMLFGAIADNTGSDPLLGSVTKTYKIVGSSGTTLEISSPDSTLGNIVVGMIVIGQGFSRGQRVISWDGDTTVILNEGPDGVVPDGALLTFVGVDPEKWTLIVPGTTWRGYWNTSNTYIQGDLSVYKNITYRCIRSTGTTFVNNPSLDTTNQYWVVFLEHDSRNALLNQGDIVYNDGEENTNLPISNLDTQVLKVVESVPSWETVFITPNVYYVATNGSDADDYPDRGLTWDHPWRTVKHACERVAEGTSNPIAKDALVSNKAWMIEEMWQWMQYQEANSISPFGISSEYDETKTRRDAGFVIDAIVYDISRGGNSQSVATAISYFEPGSSTNYFNAEVTAQMPFFIAALNYLKSLVNNTISNQDPDTNYQEENGVPEESQLVQIKGFSVELDAPVLINTLIDYVIDALTNQTTEDLPVPNQGLTATIFVKSGTYEETLPIVIPANCAVVGDELRGTVISPALVIRTYATRTNATGNSVTVISTEGMENNTPVQFVSTGVILDDFPDVTAGQTYYVIGETLTETTFQVSEEPDGEAITFTNDLGNMFVFGGDAIKDMFYMRDATGLRNMTLSGLLGTLSAPNTFLTRRPTGGSYVSLDPGLGPNDTSAWIYRRSPYVQNVTTFGTGCVGMKIDGTLHNGGNKSIVANDFTQIVSDGIGVWCTGRGSLTECVSVFTYYNYAGYFAEDGGRIRATNGNSSYGTFGVIAEGFDDTETPITGNINNRSTDAIASVQSSLGIDSLLLKLRYSNAGSNYVTSTTNMLRYSNDFTTWTTDSNININQNVLNLFGEVADAWTITGLTSGTDSSYIYKNLTINPAGATYTGLSAINITGSGSLATFDVVVRATSYEVTVNNPGTGYVATNTMYILGSQLGGRDGVNDLTITVLTLSGSSISTVSGEGTVPAGSNLSYIASLYVKKFTSSVIDLYTIFSGTSTRTSFLSYNFDTDTLTPSSSGGGLTPLVYGREVLSNGWYRIYFNVYDTNALNNTLEFRIYPRGTTGNTGATYVYGAQLQIGTGSPTFYYETLDNRYTAYANYHVVGAGTSAVILGDEIRSDSIFQVRVTNDNGLIAGGSSYLVASNNAQGGDTNYITLAQSDINEASNLERMRIFINSGTGAGQYAFIGHYNPTNKFARVLKESFTPITVVASTSGANTLELDTGFDTNELYIDMPIQFIPTYYTTEVTSASQAMQTVNLVTGGLVNTITVEDTTTLTLWMPISFSGTVFGGVITNFTYYISAIIDSTTIQISNELFGATLFLNTASGTMTLLYPANNNYFMADSTADMTINMPIQFTGQEIGGIDIGTTYYINDVIDSETFTISNQLVSVTASATTVTTNIVTINDSSGLVPLNPILFTGTSFGGILKDTKYYIATIESGTEITLASSLLSVTVTATAATSNLITVSDTTGFVADNPIKFIGTTFGGIVSGQTYYILAINNSTSFTISASVGGSSVILTTAVGEATANTAPAPITLSTASGSMVGTSTTEVITLTSGTGNMTATFSTNRFGGVVAGQDYYIMTITPGTPNTIQITATEGGTTPVTLTTATGSMQFGHVGWDHVNPGTEIAPTLDSTTLYFIEARPIFSSPPFSQTATTSVNLAPGTFWLDVTYGNNRWMAIPNTGATAMTTTNGSTWSNVVLPISGTTWTGIAYGNGYWVIISNSSEAGETGSRVLYSNSNGESWKTTYLPSKTSWNNIAYGNGVFVAIAENTTSAAYSNDFGKTWVSATGLPNRDWSGVAFGNGFFLAISTASNTGAISTNGQTWTSTTLPLTTAWSDITFGDGKFVVVSGDLSETASTFNGTDWYISKIDIQADKVAYGNGIFLALYSGSGVGYTSEDGIIWKQRTVTDSGYRYMAFGFRSSDYKGMFLTVAGTNTTSMIQAGRRPNGRVSVTSGSISQITMFETGSNFTSGTPTVEIIDPNITIPVTVDVRTSSGVLSGPTFISRGTGYNTNSTVVTITGDGFADDFQTGLSVICKNVTKLPRPGDNLVINGNSTVYKITNATALNGTVAPNLDVLIQTSPGITIALSPDHEESLSIRQLYSQVRLTGHDFLNIGFGNFEQANYPGLPTETELSPQNEAVENNFGRVFFTSTDQDGNFKVGNLFGVEQATGIVTLSASQFGLEGLSQLRLGGVAVGGSSVIVTQFSTDPTFIANSNQIIPTQKAIRGYLTSRLSQGGSNTFTGQATAGTVIIGGPNQLSNTIPEGIAGSSIRMLNKVNFFGPTAAVDGDMAAFFKFTASFFR